MPHTASSIQKPRFRHDHLLAEQIEDHGTKFVDVLDPDSGTMFRLYEAEFSLACGMDGSRDVGGLVQWAKDELGLASTPHEVSTVIATLGELGYLDETAASKAAAAEPPARRPAADGELAPGIVVPSHAPRPAPNAGIELGTPGARPAGTPAPLPTAPELALGAPGSTPGAEAPRPPVEEVALGAPGRAPEPGAPAKAPFQVSEVSLDLSEHMGVGADDVKEAVRASKVMQAVEVPKDVLDAIEDSHKAAEPVAPAPAPAPVVHAPAEPVVSRPPVASRPPVEHKPVEPRPVEHKPVAKPVEAKPVAPQPAEKPAEPRRVSPVLIVLLILVVGAAGAYVVWKYVLSKANEDTKTGMVTEPVAPQPEPPVAPPEPPPAPSAKLVVETPPPLEVTAPVAAVIEAIEAARDVKQGEIVVKLAGHAPIEQAIKNLERDIAVRIARDLERAESDLATAHASKNAAKIKAAEAFLAGRRKSLADKQASIATKQRELSRYLIEAPVTGAITPIAKRKARVAANAPLFSIAPAKVLVATLPAAEATPESEVFLAVKGGEQKLRCRVTALEDAGARIACPHDPALEAAEVTFAGLVPPEQPPEQPADEDAEIELTDDEDEAKAEPETPEPAKAAPAKAAPARRRPPRRRVVPRPRPKPPAPEPAEPPAPAPADPAAPAPAPAPAPAATGSGSASS